MNANSSNPMQKIGQIKESVIVKLMLIALIVIGLLIPAQWVQNIVKERIYRQEEVMIEVSEKWAGKQNIAGPVLRVPYIERVRFTGNRPDEVGEKLIQSYLYVAPEMLDIQADVKSKILKRSIFEVPVYNSHVIAKGHFKLEEALNKLNNAEVIKIEKAEVFVGLSDLKGIETMPELKFEKTLISLEPGTDENNMLHRNLSGSINLTEWTENELLSFNLDLRIKGTAGLRFVPLGKTTSLSMQGDWPHPSFNGVMLPSDRKVEKDHFVASWNILHYNRNLPQTWTDMEMVSSDEAGFGADFYLPVDHYQLNMRSTKYGHLLIILSFAALFLVEMIRNLRIHPIQYLLIGFALILYYSLLISFSEHTGFAWAYLIASSATTALVAWYSTSFFVPKRLAALLSGILVFFYAFIFIIIKAQDTALLLGSIALFIVLAAVMFFSRNVQWYKPSEQVAVNPSSIPNE
jgi:inner membrane protein